MKNLLKILSSISMLGLLTFVSCKKEEANLSNNSNLTEETNSGNGQLLSRAGGYTYVYKLDLQNVKVLDLSDPNLTILYELQPNNVMFVHGFTSIDNYIQYGTKQGWNAKLEVEVENHLHNYADLTGVEAEAEATGKIPAWWATYVDNYLASKYPSYTSSSLSTRALSTTIYEDFNAQGRSLTMIPLKKTYAWLKIWGMKNTVSSFLPASLVRGIDIAYDNPFFNTILFRFKSGNNTPGFPINLNGVNAPFNDRAESWISLGI